MSTLGVYLARDSLLHRLPAGLKLLGLVVIAVGTLFLDQPWQIGVFCACVIALYGIGRIPWRTVMAQLRPLLWLILVLAAFQVVVNGWQIAIIVVGVLAGLVLLAALVSLTTRTTDIVDVVARVCRPLRRIGVDSERVGLLVALGIRSIPVVLGLAREVREAQLARGLTSSPTAFAVPLVVRSLRHADQLAEALAGRGVDD